MNEKDSYIFRLQTLHGCDLASAEAIYEEEIAPLLQKIEDLESHIQEQE